MTERPKCVLTELESDHWRLLQPLTLWVFQNSAGWSVGDYGPFHLLASGPTFEDAQNGYCRALIECAETIERRGETFDGYLERREGENGD